ncbi:MAG: UDP-4-amino-4,6-dideoxy-N-acetyl-beta-L-altrosamine N-acetyltransferase [Neptuniibacter sp.]
MTSSQMCVRRMESSDLELVLAWRNHPDVRSYMYTKHEISLVEHTRWFEKASKSNGAHLLIFEYEGVPRGFCNIKEIADGGIADWGFYIAPEASTVTGRMLGEAVLTYAFTTAKIHKLCGQVLKYNKKSIIFHKKMGFVQEGVLRDQHYDGLKYHDVVCFGLFANEWKLNS